MGSTTVHLAPKSPGSDPELQMASQLVLTTEPQSALRTLGFPMPGDTGIGKNAAPYRD